MPFLSQGSIRSGTRIGYFESSSGQSWSANYVYLDGWMQRRLNPKETDYLIQVTTQEGSLAIDIADENGLVFTETNIPTGRYPLTLTEKVTIKITAEDHKGSFSIEPQ